MNIAHFTATRDARRDTHRVRWCRRPRRVTGYDVA